MKLNELMLIISRHSEPVILLEGTRSLPKGEACRLTTLRKFLAKTFPHARFRTGNATGSDEAFAAGVAAVDARRLEYILPYAGHRKKNIPPGARCIALNKLADDDMEMDRLIKNTLQASPDYKDMLTRGKSIPKLKAKINYLLRDTLKVIGIDDNITGATAGIFFSDPIDPMKGGTGHTIRVCLKNGVPAIL